ncbi:MAG: hypothetical protein M1514_02370 [Patescibacteria group bacterium]|nr:hypothetical protein [Patescibacteria group bacterium]
MQLSNKAIIDFKKVYRNRHHVAKRLNLKDSEYRLWDLYLAVYDWDKKHEETYQTVETADKVLANVLNWSPSKVCRVRNRLIKKEAIREKARSFYEVVLLPSSKNNVAKLQDDNANLQDQIAELQENTAKLQSNQDKTDQTTIVSYKGKYCISTEEEYRSVKDKVDLLSQKIGNNWFDDQPEVKQMIFEHEALANAMLSYEIDHDLLPI